MNKKNTQLLVAATTLSMSLDVFAATACSPLPSDPVDADIDTLCACLLAENTNLDLTSCEKLPYFAYTIADTTDGLYWI